MRPATADDVPAVEEMILARSGWLAERGLPSWRDNAADLARQAENPEGDVWVLAEDDGRIMTDPAYRDTKPGTVMGLWAVDRAAQEGRTWVRRGCHFPELVRYNEAQGFKLLHEVQRTHTKVYLMGRRAERINDMAERFRAL